jgi:phage gp29-like protein
MQGWSSWVKFLERFADPLLLGIVNDPQSFVDLLRGQGFQSVVAVSQGESVSTVTSSGGGEFERLDAACSKRIQKLILGQTLTTDIGNTGSYAAAQVHDSVRDDKRRSDCRLITPTVQRLINSLWELNNFEGEPPVFTLQDDVGLEAARAERDNALAQYGLLTFTEKYFIDKYDLRPGDFIIPDQTTSAPSAATKASATSRIFKLTDSDINLAAMATDKKPGLELIDDLIAGTMQESNSPIKEDLILEAIKASSGPADLEERLAILMDKKYSGNFSNLTAFTTMLENALYYANVIGYASAQ